MLHPIVCSQSDYSVAGEPPVLIKDLQYAVELLRSVWCIVLIGDEMWERMAGEVD